MWRMPRITLAKEELAKPAIEKPVPTTIMMSVPLWSVQIAFIDFTETTVLTIIVKKINAPNTELVPSVIQNTMSSRASDIGFATCSSCKEMVEIHAHKCFIQPAVDHPEEDVDDDDNGKKKPLPPPLFVYADIEAMQLPDRQFEATLLCYRTSESETIVTHKGKNCVCTFLHDLDDATEIPANDRERTVIVIFHNLKSFDGMFIIDELYKQQRGIENQLTVGSKVLSFESASITFKDSLCFLPMPLASFPSAFNLTELKKRLLSSRIQFATSPKLRGLHPWHGVFSPRWNV